MSVWFAVGLVCFPIVVYSSLVLTGPLLLTGITPIIQVARAIVNDMENSNIELWVLYANRSEEDILLRTELEELSFQAGTSRLRVHHCLSRPPEGWAYSRGRITIDMLRDHLPLPNSASLVLVCGPDPMINDTVKPGLSQLGWDVETSLVVF